MDDTEFIVFKKQMEKELKTLKRKNNLLLLIIASGLSFLTITSFISKKAETYNSIRTKELIVEDKYGNDRIIISPLISLSKTRIRKDTLSGVLVLDENGNDRVVLGASPTVNIDGKIIKRSTNGPYGLAFNDESKKEGLVTMQTRDFLF